METVILCTISLGSNVVSVGHDFPSKEEALGRLPDDLQAYVLDDNQKLQDEIQQWDASKALIAAEGEHDGAGAKSSLGAPDILSSVNPDIGTHHDHNSIFYIEYVIWMIIT